jgi:hypothetical protein
MAHFLNLRDEVGGSNFRLYQHPRYGTIFLVLDIVIASAN